MISSIVIISCLIVLMFYATRRVLAPLLRDELSAERESVDLKAIRKKLKNTCELLYEAADLVQRGGHVQLILRSAASQLEEALKSIDVNREEEKVRRQHD